MSYDNSRSVSQNVLKFYQQLTGSLIAATDTGDKDGNDNGQLSLTTNSLN
jgi:hypothetical protein